MLKEIGVLGGDEGLPDLLGHGINGHRVAPGFAEQADQAAIVGIDVQRLLQLHVTQGFDVRNLGRNHVVQDAQANGTEQRQGDEGD